MRITLLACEAHHSPPSSAQMYGGIPPLPHMPSWYCTHMNLLLRAVAVVVIMSNGLEKSPPVYPFNRWLMGTRAGQGVVERSLAPARNRTLDLSARMLLPTNWSGVTVKFVRPGSHFGVSPTASVFVRNTFVSTRMPKCVLLSIIRSEIWIASFPVTSPRHAWTWEHNGPSELPTPSTALLSSRESARVVVSCFTAVGNGRMPCGIRPRTEVGHRISQRQNTKQRWWYRLSWDTQRG